MRHYISGNMYSLSDVGKVRTVNEDSCETRINAFGDVLLIVCDGMGGRNNGDYASNKLKKTLIDEFMLVKRKFRSNRQIIHWAYKHIKRVNKEIYLKSQNTHETSGTTLSLVILSDDKMITAQVGDSRIYIVNNNKKLQQLSVDQSYVQYLEHANLISKDEMASHPERHKITNAIGIRKRANVDFRTFEYADQKVLVCSDGLYNNVPTNHIESILKGSDTAERKCKQLVNFANANGGSDNISVVIWETNK